MVNALRRKVPGQGAGGVQQLCLCIQVAKGRMGVGGLGSQRGSISMLGARQASFFDHSPPVHVPPPPTNLE